MYFIQENIQTVADVSRENLFGIPYLYKFLRDVYFMDVTNSAFL